VARILIAALGWSLVVAFVVFSLDADAHRGSLDQNGGHYNRKEGGYHQHRDPSEMELGSNGRWRLSCEAGSKSKDCACLKLTWDAPTHRENGDTIEPGFIKSYVVTIDKEREVTIDGDKQEADCHDLGLPLGSRGFSFYVQAVDDKGLISKPSVTVND